MTFYSNPKLIKDILSIDGWLTEKEGLILYNLTRYKSKGTVFVEIGSFLGKSTIFTAIGLKDSKSNAKIYAIDPHLGILDSESKKGRSTYQDFLKNLDKFRVSGYVIPIKKESEKANISWEKKIDFLFIDGIHEYEFVKKDIEIWLPFMKKEGVVIFHDAFCPYREVYRAIRETVFERPDVKFIGEADSIVYCILDNDIAPTDKLKLTWIKLILDLSRLIWDCKPIPESLQFKIVNRLRNLLPLNKKLLIPRR